MANEYDYIPRANGNYLYNNGASTRMQQIPNFNQVQGMPRLDVNQNGASPRGAMPLSDADKQQIQSLINSQNWNNQQGGMIPRADQKKGPSEYATPLPYEMQQSAINQGLIKAPNNAMANYGTAQGAAGSNNSYGADVGNAVQETATNLTGNPEMGYFIKQYFDSLTDEQIQQLLQGF